MHDLINGIEEKLDGRMIVLCLNETAEGNREHVFSTRADLEAWRAEHTTPRDDVYVIELVDAEA